MEFESAHLSKEEEEEDGARSTDCEDAEEEPEADPGSGWADAMAKILTKTSKTEILKKRKDLSRSREQQEDKQKTDQKLQWENMCREKADISKDQLTERALQRIATRGVVQLFNAVKKQQRTLDESVKEVGGSERKKAKILSSLSKKDFISVLRNAEDTNKSSHNTEVPTDETKPTWSVLRDDFMMEAKMKDWDKDDDREDTGQRI